MSDRNKMALLCLLLVLAFAIWRKPSGISESESQTIDIFQDRKSFNLENVIKLESNIPADRMRRLKETVKCDFGSSPF